MHVCSKLYNFCANGRLAGLLDIVRIADEGREGNHMPSATTERMEGNSMMRDFFVEKISFWAV